MMINHLRRPRLSLIGWLALSILAPSAAQAATNLFLLDDRFEVEATWRTAGGQTGTGTAVRLTDQTGYFWFFAPENIEVVVKALDACAPPFDRFWFFASGLTDTEVTLRVTDLTTGQEKTYVNPLGRPFQPIQDTGAFDICNVPPPPCGRGSDAELARTPRADTGLEHMALIMGGGFTARQNVYDRVVADIAAIQAQQPALTEFSFEGFYAPDAVVLKVDAATAAQIRAGTYRGWDCLNERYSGIDNGISAISPVVDVRFSGIYDILQIAQDYQTLPGVVDAWRDLRGMLPEDPLMRICGAVTGTTYHYYFANRTAFGTPPLGTYYFTSEPGAAPQFQGFAPLGGTSPDWLPVADQCLRSHSHGYGGI
jgi:hypothetical protein